MRDLAFFDKKVDYEDYIWNDVFVEDWVWNTPFYRKLVNFIVDHRAPVFYTISDPSEHFAFSGAYHFETRRERYPNKAREQLFWLHDFTHMLFPYAHDVYNVSEAEFLAQFWYQERIASSETEIMAYYRVPELREKVFPDEKLYYDVLRERDFFNLPDRADSVHLWGQKPDATLLLQHRVLLTMDDEYGEEWLGDYPEILKFFQQWRRLTPKWISERYRSVAGRRIPDFNWNRGARVHDYEERIEAYESKRSSNRTDQDQYERMVMQNVHVAFGLLGWEDPPERWRHVPEAFDQLEGAVFFK